MLAYVDIKGLHAALHRVAPVAPKKPTVPILSSLLVEARETDGSVRITASDLDQRLTMRVDASVVAGGSLAYPAEALTALIKNLPGDASQVELSSSGGITAGKSQATLTTEPGDIYPADMVGAPAVRISEEAAEALADAITACLPAAEVRRGMRAAGATALGISTHAGSTIEIVDAESGVVVRRYADRRRVD